MGVSLFHDGCICEFGMSGGPVLGTHGRVIGLVSSCMESINPGEEPHTSHYALAAGLLEVSLHVPDTDGNEHELTVGQMASAGIISIDGSPASITARPRRCDRSLAAGRHDGSASMSYCS